MELHITHQTHFSAEEIPYTGIESIECQKVYFKWDFILFRSEQQITGERKSPFKNRFMVDNNRITSVDTWKWESQVLISVFVLPIFLFSLLIHYFSLSTFLRFHQTSCFFQYTLSFFTSSNCTVQTLKTYMCSIPFNFALLRLWQQQQKTNAHTETEK